MDVSLVPNCFSSIGGLCVGSVGEIVEFLSGEVGLIQAGDKDAAILELEILAISVAVHLRKPLMSTKRVVVVADNEAVRSIIIRGYSKNRLVDCLMGRFFCVKWVVKFGLREC